MFLLAESITLDTGIIFTVASIVFGAGGAVGVMKLKSVLAEKKAEDLDSKVDKGQEKLERVDERIFDEIKELGKTMQRRFNAQDEKAASAEKSMVGKLENFQSKVFHRLDDLQGKVSEQDKRLTVAETEARHTKEKVDKHAKKITMFGKTPFKSDNR